MVSICLVFVPSLAAAVKLAKPLPLHVRAMQLRARAVGEASISDEDKVVYAIEVSLLALLTFLSRSFVSRLQVSPEVPARASSLAVYLSRCAVLLDRRVIKKMVFRQWTIGRCLDSICKHAGVDNQNNLLHARVFFLFLCLK